MEDQIWFLCAFLGKLNPFKAVKNIVNYFVDSAQNSIDSITGMIVPDINFPEEKIVAMPDQEEQKKIARRNAAKRRGGRASTILTGDDTLG